MDYAQPALAADGQGAECESRNANLRFRIESELGAGGPQLKRHRWVANNQGEGDKRMRKIIRTIIIFWGILALFPALIIGYLFITTYGHSYDGGASATIWNDENGNGIRDEDEIGLPNVCIAEGLPEWGADYVIERCKENIHDHSDENGEWSRFLPGGKCEDTYLFVEIPSGFQPTTNLASNSCNAEFGFTPKKSIVTQNIQSIEQFIQQYYLFLWIRRIAIGLFILFVCIFGTIWLQKEPKRE